jgi:hypothetical protein
MIREEIIKKLSDNRGMLKSYGVKSIRLFGSVARGDAVEGSDMPEPIPAQNGIFGRHPGKLTNKTNTTSFYYRPYSVLFTHKNSFLRLKTGLIFKLILSCYLGVGVARSPNGIGQSTNVNL